ncbi:hypothetical protein ADUPG1_008436 [Aduncisulcus paluster]|uniref:Ubiquitin-like domain-containing protein n=1 Tax=Aduncisulcus paluster TaxID=2918883 RepID=A0ABQ5KRZ6_9EUKA|nr:hypothetical protein ADUPG1_008436 [Aduncisulcus paluster]
MKLRLSFSTGGDYEVVDVADDTAPRDLQEFISENFGIRDRLIRIIFQGQILSGHTPLQSSGVSDGSVLIIGVSQDIHDDSEESSEEEEVRGLEALLDAGIPPEEVLTHRCNLILRTCSISANELNHASRALRIFATNVGLGDDIESCAVILHQLYRDECDHSRTDSSVVLGDSGHQDILYFPHLSPSGRPLDHSIIELEDRWLNGDENLNLPGLQRAPGQDPMYGLMGLMGDQQDMDQFMPVWKMLAWIAVGMFFTFVTGPLMFFLAFASGIPTMFRLGVLAGLFTNFILGICVNVGTKF